PCRHLRDSGDLQPGSHGRQPGRRLRRAAGRRDPRAHAALHRGALSGEREPRAPPGRHTVRRAAPLRAAVRRDGAVRAAVRRRGRARHPRAPAHAARHLVGVLRRLLVALRPHPRAAELAPADRDLRRAPAVAAAFHGPLLRRDPVMAAGRSRLLVAALGPGAPRLARSPFRYPPAPRRRRAHRAPNPPPAGERVTAPGSARRARPAAALLLQRTRLSANTVTRTSAIDGSQVTSAGFRLNTCPEFASISLARK